MKHTGRREAKYGAQLKQAARLWGLTGRYWRSACELPNWFFSSNL